MSIHTLQYNDKECRVFDATVPIAWSVCTHSRGRVHTTETESSPAGELIKEVGLACLKCDKKNHIRNGKDESGK